MRARCAVLALASLGACAGFRPPTERPVASPAASAHPEPDPAARWTPRSPALLPIEQVAVRVLRLQDGRTTIVEFLNPGLSEADRTALRLAFEEGKVRLAAEGAGGEESWTTTLLPSAP